MIGALATLGATYEMIAGLDDSAAYPMVGKMVDVGGYQLHINCIGQGSPTVILDAGMGGSSLDWILVQRELSANSRVCAYDRAGMGWSDPGPGPRSPAQIAAELHKLLVNARLPAPFILVAHSLSGKAARLYAAAHPGQVAGIVLVDTRTERVDGLILQAETDTFNAMLENQATAYSIARHLGLARLFGAILAGKPLLAPDIATEMVLLQTQGKSLKAMTQEGLTRAADDAELAETSLGSIPLVVVAASESMSGIPNWSEAQMALAALSTNGRLVVAEGSSHLVQLDQPVVVIGAIRSVLTAVRNDR